MNSVGIDRVIARADVARASLYSTFGSKDELIRAYLEHRMEISQARLRAAVEGHADPRERLLSVFGAQAALFARPGYHGCAFDRATAEAQPGSAAYDVPRAHRRWLRGFLRDLAHASSGRHRKQEQTEPAGAGQGLLRRERRGRGCVRPARRSRPRWPGSRDSGLP